MRADPKKVALLMARACIESKQIEAEADVSRQSLSRVITGKNAKPATIGRVAKALGVDVTEILED